MSDTINRLITTIKRREGNMAVISNKCFRLIKVEAEALETKANAFKDYMKCSRCGDYFNMGDLSRVLAHETCPVMSIKYESKRIS